jgi:predicted enzyme related to lactoylglutathione lyase
VNIRKTAKTTPKMRALIVERRRVMENLPPHWFTCIAVEDVDAAVAATPAAGGRVIKDVVEVPDRGRMAIIADPAGASLGIMTPGRRD